MERIQFSELTNRLHCNLVAAASLIICITRFDIRVEKATTSGIELVNFTTGVLLTILIAVLIYHACAFGVPAFEEYRFWELKLTDEETTFASGRIDIVNLAQKLKNTSETLQKITKNSGKIQHQGQNIFTKEDADQLKAAAEAALVYGKRFKNFPTITRWRFWAWDIGVAGLVTMIAIVSCALKITLWS